MPPPPLPVEAIDLLDYPGAPFPELVVLSAAAALRSDAGWHIAPVYSDTVTVDGAASRLLLLPTLRLVSVSAVRVVSGDAPVTLTGWRVAGSGMLYHDLGWDYGIASVEVDMTHGFDFLPEDLEPVVADRCRRALYDVKITQKSETVGGWSTSETYNAEAAVADSSSLARYRLPSRVA